MLEGLTFEKRRQDWLLGRWTAKKAIRRLPDSPPRPLADWQICAAADGAPEAWLGDEPAVFRLSLSHSHGHCLCAISALDLRMGCDIEHVEVRSRAFEETYFTGSELELLPGRDDHGLTATVIWSAKESVLKALRTGLRSDTRRVRIESIRPADTPAWSRFHAVDDESGDQFQGWWQTHGEMLITIACDDGRPGLMEL